MYRELSMTNKPESADRTARETTTDRPRPIRCLAAALLLVTAVSSAPVAAQTYDFAAGSISAIDGDTLRIGGVRIRLSAIDAPELSQVCRIASGRRSLCGGDAQRALAALIRRGLRCTVETVDRYGREVASCITPSNRDVGGELVRQGWAIPYWRYDGARYAKAYREARAARAGMHAGTFIDPEEWRRGARW